MLDQHLGGADLYVFRFCSSFCNDLTLIVTLICISVMVQWNACEEKDWGLKQHKYRSVVVG